MEIIFGKSYEEDTSAIRDCREVISCMEDNADVNDAPIASWDCAEAAFDVYDCEPSETGIAIVNAFIGGADPEPMITRWRQKISDYEYPKEERIFELNYTCGPKYLTGWATQYGADKITMFIGDMDGIIDQIDLTESEYSFFIDTMDDLFESQSRNDCRSIFPMRRFVYFGDFEHSEEEYLEDQSW